MDSARAYIGLAAGALLISASVPYLYSILRGTTRPSRVSWGVWTLVGLVLLASYRASGATDTIWLATGYFVVPLAVFLLSLRYRAPGFSHFDLGCLTGALLGIAAWVALRSAPAAVFICIAVDAVGALPTLRKAYSDPLSEDLRAWLIGFGASAVNVLAIGDWTPRISLYPLYSVVSVGLIAMTLLVRRRVLPAGSPTESTP